MVKNAHMEFVNGLQRLLTTGGESPVMDSLLLSFGALANRAPPESKVAIVSFLIRMETTVGDSNTPQLIHLLLAMGNTGSDYTIDVILGFVDHPRRDIQTASIGALLKFTHHEQVLNRLTGLLTSNPDKETLITIMRTLIKGQEYAEKEDTDTAAISNHPILPALVSAALRMNDTDLIGSMSVYLRRVGGEQSLVLLDELHTRLTRGTAWDELNSDYDCIAIPYSRQYDVSAFPKHSAYLHHKVIGTSDINLKVTAGVFMGMSDDCNTMMSFARVCVDGNVFSESRYLADAEAWVEKSGSIHGEVFFSVAGSPPIVYEQTTSCFSYDDQFNQLPEHLFEVSFPLWIYVGSVDYSVTWNLGYDVVFDDQLCSGLVESPGELISSITGVVLDVSVTIEGSARHTFMVSKNNIIELRHKGALV